MIFFFVATLVFSLFLEGAVTNLPLVLVILLCLTIYKRDGSVFPIAFLAGFFLDIQTVQTIGASSLFFVVMVFLILLYQRKYEINSYLFVAMGSFLGSLGYLLLFGYGNWFFSALLSSVVGLLFFAVLRFFGKDLKTQKENFKAL